MKNTINMLSPVTDGQMNSFIITTSDEKVIVIDGGYRNDAENLIEYLKKLTQKEIPHIDAWIMSHAHVDHISCFNEIVEKYWDCLTVDKIIYNFPSSQFCARETAWGNYYPAADEFYANLPHFADRAVIAYGSDEYDIGEAHIEILYSPNSEIQCNFINNSSLIFMLTLGGKKILFTGDAGVEEGERCLSVHGSEKLKADIVQMAHHGQGGVAKSFYEAVSPKACLWCTPRWLWDNDVGNGFNTYIFQTVTVRGWMEELGVTEHYVIKDGTQTIEL